MDLRKGFSLIEIVIGIGILAIVGVFVTATLRGVNIGGGQVDSRAQFNQSMQLLQRVLMNSSICAGSIDRSNAITLDFAVPSRFDVAFDVNGFGPIRAGAENRTLNYFFDEVYVDAPIFSEVSSAGHKTFVGLLKVNATQRLLENAIGVRGLKFKTITVGAISVSLTDTKMIVDCQMQPRGL